MFIHESFLKKDSFQYFTFFLILLIGLLLRILAWHKYSIPFRDAYVYSEMIRQWEETDCYPLMAISLTRYNDIPPLSLFLFKVFHSFFPSYDIITCGVVVNLIIGILFILAIWFLTYLIFHSKILSNMASLLSATNPFLIESSIQMTREMSYLLFVICTIIFLIRFIQGKIIYNVIFSAFFATCSFMCRYEGGEFLCIFPMLIVFLLITKEIRWKIFFEAFALFYITVAGTIASITCMVNLPLEYYRGPVQKFYGYFAPFL